MSTPTLSVYAYGNVDALHGIFNAIAMVMGSNDFHDMVKLAVIIGFLVAASIAVMPQNLWRGFSWFINVALMSGILLAPKANVAIVDKLGSQPPVIVANVPWALALIATVKSSIGSTLTDLIETAFQTIPADIALPAELAYERHGVMFGNRLVRASREVGFSSLYTQGDTLNFLRNCVFPDLAREEIPGTFEHSTSLIETIAHTNPALFSTYHASEGLIAAPCPEVFDHAVAPGVADSAHDAMLSMSAALMPGVPFDVSEPQVEDALTAMYGKAALANAATSAADIMIQNILINATADASMLYGVALNDPSVLMFASMRSQAVAQTNAGHLVQGRIAEEALPMLRNITEAILYALFPVMCILAMACEGVALARLIKSYLYIMVWVELWPPCFAIVSCLATLASAKNLAAAAYMGAGLSGVSLQTATGIYSAAISDVSVASWMVTAVPIIAAGLLFGMDRILWIAGASGSTSASEHAAADGSKGNMSLGNLSFDQQEMMEYRSSPSVRRISGIGGMSMTQLLSGESVDTYAQSSGPVSLRDTAGWGQRMSENAAVAAQSSETHRKSYETALDAAYGQTMSLLRSGGKSVRISTDFEVGRESAEALDRADREQSAEQIAKQFGISDTSVVAKSIEAGLGAPIAFKAMVGMSSKEQENLQAAINDARSSSHFRSVERKQGIVDRFRESNSFDSVRSANVQASRNIESTMHEAESHRTSAVREYAESERWQRAREKYKAFMRAGEASWGNEFYDFARSRGIDPTHGKASTDQLRTLLNEFVLSGDIARYDDGEYFWVPQLGQGPNIMQGRENSISPDSLRTNYENQTVGKGTAGVVHAHTRGDGRLATEQLATGITPSPMISGSGLQNAVTEHQVSLQEAVSAESKQISHEEGRLRLSEDERATTMSSLHEPLVTQNPVTGKRIANTALDAVRFHNRPFGTEAERAREEEESAQSKMGKQPPSIPAK